MKKMYLKVCAGVLALLTAAGMAACDNKDDTSSKTETQTAPVESIAEEIEEPDIGEHKDYDQENAEGYDSNDILIVDQDGTKRGMELYEQGLGYAEFYGNELNTIKDRLGRKVNVYSMIVPTVLQTSAGE